MPHLEALSLILQSFDWLATFHLELLQAAAPVFLATCFKCCSRGLPTAFFPGIAPSRMFTKNSLSGRTDKYFKRFRKIAKSDYYLRHIGLFSRNNSTLHGRIFIQVSI